MRRVNVRGIIVNDRGEIFAQRLTARDRDGRDFWCTPGGGLDMGEGLVHGLKREIIEETGVAPEVGKLLFIQQFTEMGEDSAHGACEQLEFFFEIKNWQDYENIDLEATTHGVEEIAKCGFIDPKNEVLLPKFLSEIDLKTLEKQSEVLVYDNLMEK